MMRKMLAKPWVKIKIDDLDLFVKMACSLSCERDAVRYTDEGGKENGRKWVFRGQSDSRWVISSTLERHKTAGDSQDLGMKKKEQMLYDKFVREASCYTLIDAKKIFDVLAMMRHYKVPTRLVDFSESPFVSLYFGAENVTDRDFSVWAVCVDDLDEYSACDDVINLHPKGVKSFRTKDFDKLRMRFENNFWAVTEKKVVPRMFYAYPQHGNMRQSAQSGLFLLQSSLRTSFMRDMIDALGCDESKIYSTSVSHLYRLDRVDDVIRLSRIVQFVLPNQLRDKCMSLLYAMNISAKTLYPGLEGIGLSLSQHILLK